MVPWAIVFGPLQFLPIMGFVYLFMFGHRVAVLGSV